VTDAPVEVFAALGDPTRLAVLRAVAARAPVTATELAGVVPVTRQAVAKHLAVLRDAGLVTCTREGREARYAPAGDGLDAAARWLAQAGSQWDRRLARLSARARSRGAAAGKNGAA
jgi:DNA-binding transcriptional ArsR family regulator